jgi:hypothetical protein
MTPGVPYLNDLDFENLGFKDLATANCGLSNTRKTKLF